MNLAATINRMQAFGTPEGAEKGWDTRGRGRKPEETKPASNLKGLLQQAAKAWGENNTWALLGKYGHVGNTEPFTPEEQKELRKLKRTMGEPCRVGFCVMNAQRLANMGLLNPKVKYVEGLVTVHGVPIDHAWIEYNGKVYDPTLADEKWNMKGKTPKGEYFGVEVPKEAIWPHQAKTGMYNFISHQRWDKDLQKKIWK